MILSLPFGTCDVCGESFGAKRYPKEGDRLLCQRHAPRRGYEVPPAIFIVRKPKRVFRRKRKVT